MINNIICDFWHTIFRSTKINPNFTWLLPTISHRTSNCCIRFRNAVRHSCIHRHRIYVDIFTIKCGVSQIISPPIFIGIYPYFVSFILNYVAKYRCYIPSFRIRQYSLYLIFHIQINRKTKVISLYKP